MVVCDDVCLGVCLGVLVCVLVCDGVCLGVCWCVFGCVFVFLCCVVVCVGDLGAWESSTMLQTSVTSFKLCQYRHDSISKSDSKIQGWKNKAILNLGIRFRDRKKSVSA